ncbi:hypothetical protein JCM6882_001281 [Rhodosporidiobolus microsporus]
MLFKSLLPLLAVTGALAMPSPLLRRETGTSDDSPFAAAGYWLTDGNATLPDLPYNYSALQPSISEEIMTLHHDRHHRTFVNGFNTGMASLKAAMASGNSTAILRLLSSINLSGGGHINHSLFWRNLAPNGSGGGSFPSSGPLYDVVMREYGSFDALKALMSSEGGAVQGSGWLWLGWNTEADVLQVDTSANQDIIPRPLIPLVGIDLWEHAYYIDYKNNRTAYLSNIWDVINWGEAESRLTAIQGGANW